MRQILTNFTAGEVTPKLDGRVDIAKYFNSVKTLFNMIVYPYGGVTRRAGTKFVYPTRNGASRSRLIPFRFSTNYIMEVGEGYARFFEAGGVPISITGVGGPAGIDAYYIFESDFTSNINGWQDYSAASPTSSRIGWEAGAAIYPDILDDNCTDLTGWVNVDSGAAVTEVDPVNEFRFDTNTGTPLSTASIYNHTDALPDKFTVELKTYFNAIGTMAQSDYFRIVYSNGSWVFRAAFASDGLFIFKAGGAYTEASVNLVKCNASAAWQTWRFEVDKSSGETAATVAVYVDGSNQGTALCNYQEWVFPRRFYMDQLAETNDNRITHVDYAKIATGNGSVGYPPGLGLYTVNAATIPRAVRVLSVPSNGQFLASVHNQSATVVNAIIGSTLHGSDITATKTMNTATATSWDFNCASISNGSLRQIYFELIGTNTGTSIIDQVKISRYETDVYEIATTINEASVANLRYAQREDTTFMVSSQCEMPPAELIRYDHDDWTFGNITFDYDPFNGATTVGYPACVSFFEQRSLWGNTPGDPQKIWASVTGVYRSLEIGIADDDGFAFSLDAEDYCPIYSIAPTKQLVALTGGGLFKISSDAYTEPITPTNFFSRRAERTAAADMMPAIVGVSILFMEEHNRMLGEAKYDAAADGIAVTDMAILSEHLLNSNMNGSTVIEVAYQKTPDNILWCLQHNGNLLGFTFNPKQEVMGWHRHETDGSVESIAVIPGRNYDELWMIVNRQISGSASRIIEVMQSPEFENTQTCWFLDSAVWYDGAGATTITGLEHLNGATVGVFADGTVFDEGYVTGGTLIITANGTTTAASKILVGRKFTSRVQSMRAEIQGQQGTSQGRLKRIFRLVARVLKTAAFKAGYDWDNLDQITTRTMADPMGAPITLTTGDIEILPFRGDWDKEGYICIEQTEPVPLTVTALIMDLKVDE